MSEKFNLLISNYTHNLDDSYPIVFLSGKMAGLTYEERTGWRNRLASRIQKYCTIADPTRFDPDNPDPEYQDYAYRWDLEQIINCRYFVINLDYQSSVGTAQEIMFAWLCGKEILGLKTNKEPLHPWYENKINVMFNNIEDLGDYILDYEFV